LCIDLRDGILIACVIGTVIANKVNSRRRSFLEVISGIERVIFF